MSRALLLGTNQGTRKNDLRGIAVDNTNLAELFADILFDKEKSKQFQESLKLYEEQLSQQIEDDIKSVIYDLNSGEKKD